MIQKITVKVSFLPRDREHTVPMYITDLCQNDRNEKLYKKKNSRMPGHAPRTKLWPDLASSHYAGRVQEYFKSNKICYVPKWCKPANKPKTF